MKVEKTKKSRQQIIRIIKKAIGSGRLFTERGQTWLVFARGKTAWNTARRNLTKKFGQFQNETELYNWVISKRPKVVVVLKPYEKGTNNIIDIDGIYWW